MTIKQFAALCGCSAQTLRYYDKATLLCPARVDPWTGYRYYDEEQAVVFVKIKNLQKAGFTIEEIKPLLLGDNQTVCRAIEEKIAETENRLREMKTIRASYLSEMKTIREKINEVMEKVTLSMRQYDPSEEFGISTEEYAAILHDVECFFDNMAQLNPREIGYDEYSDGEEAEEEEEYLRILENPDYETIYEKHGWEHVKDFFGEIEELEDGAEYALCFRIKEEKERYNTAFGNTVLGILLARNPDKKKSLSCSMSNTVDDQNHFWLRKKKQ